MAEQHRRMTPLAAPIDMNATSMSACKEKPDSVVVAADHHHLQFTGRFHRTAGSSRLFAWSGSQITMRFVGKALDVILTDLSERKEGETEGNVLILLLDDQLHHKLELKRGCGQYRIIEDLSAGEHTITLFKQTEASVGAVEFHGFTIENGSALPPPPPRGRRIAFFGDSITCGFGNEGHLASERFLPSTENHYLSYGQLTTRALNAECHTVAWSGEGVLRNALGRVVYPLPVIYNQILPPRAEPAWDLSSWVPHVVIINLGTNDFLTGIPDREAFISAYVSFLQVLYDGYACPRIFCCLGPLLVDTSPMGESKLSTARRYLNEVVIRAKERGLPAPLIVEFDPLIPAEFGALWHPNLKAHRRMATILTEAIQRTTGW